MYIRICISTHEPESGGKRKEGRQVFKMYGICSQNGELTPQTCPVSAKLKFENLKLEKKNGKLPIFTHSNLQSSSFGSGSGLLCALTSFPPAVPTSPYSNMMFRSEALMASFPDSWF